MINFWLFVHLTGLVLLAAGVGVANLSGIMMSKTDSPNCSRCGASSTSRRARGDLPGALLLIVAGSILVDTEGFDYSATWVVSAYVLWVISVVLGGVVLGRHTHRIDHAASEEVKQGLTVSTEAVKLARSPFGPVVETCS